MAYLLRKFVPVTAIAMVTAGVCAQQPVPEPVPAPVPAPAPAPTAPANVNPTPEPPDESLRIPVTVASGFEIDLKVPEEEPGLKATRALLLFSKVADKVKEPRSSLRDWTSPPQVLGMDWKATDGKMIVTEAWNGFPKALREIEPGVYWVQAVVRRNLDGAFPGGNNGDAFSEPMLVRVDHASEAKATLEVTKVHTEPQPQTNARTKLFTHKSELLSKFYGRDVSTKVGIFVPRNFTAETEKSYPIVLFIGGFGSTHYDLGSAARSFPASFLANVILVVPDPSTYYGHSVFADSENNGPRGRALVEELLPAIEKEYRGKGAGHRYVTGISSGGWSSLWLQVTYPDQFAGCWSFCPDPVDFRDFQQIDLYSKDANMYTDTAGGRRPLARSGDVPMLWYDNFVKMESAIGPSGQIGAFEAVFSAKGADGKPVPLFDRVTGAVDPAVARSWQKFDMRAVLENNWGELSKKLAGKLHVYAGGKDTFYLNGAAELLKTSLKNIGSDAVVEVVPDMVHTIHKPGITAMVAEISAREGFSDQSNKPKVENTTPADAGSK